jgi:hypothetical protein
MLARITRRILLVNTVNNRVNKALFIWRIVPMFNTKKWALTYESLYKPAGQHADLVQISASDLRCLLSSHLDQLAPHHQAKSLAPLLIGPRAMLQISCGAMDGIRVVVATFSFLSARDPFEVSKIVRSAGDYGVRCENSKEVRSSWR